MMTLLFWLINVATIVVVYFFWIRPLLGRTPAFKSLIEQDNSRFAALSAKFAGIKQRLTAAVIYLASIVIAVHDVVAPRLTGVDVTPLFPKIVEYVPQTYWPFIMIGLTALLDYFRSLADKRQE